MTLHFRRSPFDDVDGRKELKKEADMLDLECSSTYIFFPTNLSKTFWLICSECLLPAFGNFIGKQKRVLKYFVLKQVKPNLNQQP